MKTPRSRKRHPSEQISTSLFPSVRSVAIVVSLALVAGWLIESSIALADDELANLSLGGPIPAATVDISEKNIEQRESELKNIEENLLQRINGSRPGSSPVAQSDIARDDEESGKREQKTPTIRAATYTVDTPRRYRGSPQDTDGSDSLMPARGPTHSVPVEQSSAKVSTEQRLAIAESQVTILSRELETSRRGLRSAEKRIEELSELVKGHPHPPRPASSDFSYGNEREPLRNVRASHTVPLDEEDEEVSVQPTIRSHSSSVASVTASKAAVRTGPSKGESMLFLLPEGSEVTIDRRSGEWYRVVTDSGARGWIYGQSLLFDNGVPTGSAVRVKAVRSKYEPTHLQY